MNPATSGFMSTSETVWKRPLTTHCKRGHEWTPQNTRRQGTSRVCTVCEAARVKAHRKDPTVRARLTNYVARWRTQNDTHYRTDLKARYAERRAFIDTVRASLGCSQCGETHVACLDFHHIDPTKKDRTLSRAFANPNWSLDRVMTEIEKCVVLCSNCHRKLHWKERQIQES